jgi:hypothetical protein
MNKEKMTNFLATIGFIKEFGGDPCAKKGINRFKSYYPNKFEDLTMCEIFRDTTDQSYLKAPSDTYVVDCEKI